MVAGTPELIRNLDLSAELERMAQGLTVDWIAATSRAVVQVEQGMRRNLLRSLSIGCNGGRACKRDNMAQCRRISTSECGNFGLARGIFWVRIKRLSEFRDQRSLKRAVSAVRFPSESLSVFLNSVIFRFRCQAN